jgi:hypothetical protein
LAISSHWSCRAANATEPSGRTSHRPLRSNGSRSWDSRRCEYLAINSAASPLPPSVYNANRGVDIHYASSSITLYLVSQRLSDKLNFFRSLLEQHFGDETDFVLVPDTNALLKAADPAQYSDVIDSTSFTFVILPTVLSELDGLKRSRATQAVGDKAEKVIRIVKGLRKQGSVLEGVTVAKTITVKMIPTEPRMADLPSWLDPNNQDDRIIGSVLEIQSARPSTVVVLVTDDMNLQNKAEMAFLPWAEPPELATKTMASL